MFFEKCVSICKGSALQESCLETRGKPVHGGSTSASCLRWSSSYYLKSLSSRLLVISITALFLCGCVVTQPQMPGDPYYAPVLAPSVVPATNLNGSLYRENVGLSLFADRKATRVGDIITVVLSERTTSSKSSNIGIKKDNKMEMPVSGGILGLTPTYNGASMDTDVDSKREFKGEADADQSNRLQGNISVTVVDVFPNGTLAIRGEKWITLNRGDEYIRISGLVRPDDVTPENTVISTKIANAKITYSGEGDIANSQRMGWLSNFFNNPIWPF